MQKEGIFIRYFDYDRRLIPNSFVASMEEGVSDINEAKKRTGLTIGYPGWNLLYYILFCSLDRDNPNLIVETGTNRAFSTIIMAQGLKDSKLEGHIHSVELNEENFKIAKGNVLSAGLGEYISLNLGDSKDFLKKFVMKHNETIRFAFLDGSHLQNDAVKEFEIIYPRLADESTVVFDNTYKLQDDEDEEQRVNGALKMIMDRFGGNLVNFPNCSWFTPGMAIWQKKPFVKDWR